MLELQKIVRNNDDWRDILSSDPYNLFIREDDDRGLVLFKYNQIKSDFDEKACREARGIVLEKGTWNVICIPFFKFFNFGESYAPDIDLDKSKIYEKADGSLLKLYNYEGEWIVATNGTIDASTAPIKIPTDGIETFEDIFMDIISGQFDEFTEGLNPANTYLFEIIHPANPIIVDYDNKKELVLIGLKRRDNLAIDLDVTERRMRFVTEQVFNDFPVRVPETFDLSIDNLDDFADKADEINESGVEFEGFVIGEINPNVYPYRVKDRVKVKSPKYLKFHHLAGESMVNSLVKLIQDNETEELESYLDKLPKYVEKAYDEIMQKYEERISLYEEKVNFYRNMKEELERDNVEDVRKQVALHIKDNIDDKGLRSKLFPMIFDGKDPKEFFSNAHYKSWKREFNIKG